jgi:DNA polymerase elongation subunit (family B)
MSLEVHACSRGQLLPDPRYDAVSAITYCVRNQVHGEHDHQPDWKGVLLCPHIQEVSCPSEVTSVTANDPAATSAPPPPPPPRSCPTCSPSCPLPLLAFDSTILVQTFPSERSLLDAFVQLVHQIDPDIVLGWEIQKSSLGFIVERGYFLQRNMQEELSRILPIKTPPKAAEGFKGAERDKSNPASVEDETTSRWLSSCSSVCLSIDMMRSFVPFSVPLTHGRTHPVSPFLVASS